MNSVKKVVLTDSDLVFHQIVEGAMAKTTNLVETYRRIAEALLYPRSYSHEPIFSGHLTHVQVKAKLQKLLRKMSCEERKAAKRILNPEIFNFRAAFEQGIQRVKAVRVAV